MFELLFFFKKRNLRERRNERYEIEKKRDRYRREEKVYFILVFVVLLCSG